MPESCGAKSVTVIPAALPPLKGGKRCIRHGGRAPLVQAAAARRVAEADAQETM